MRRLPTYRPSMAVHAGAAVTWLLIALVALTLAGCDAPRFVEVTFWQEVGDTPGREIDPYALNDGCSVIDEEWRAVYDVPGDMTTVTFWIKRRYLCDASSIA